MRMDIVAGGFFIMLFGVVLMFYNISYIASVDTPIGGFAVKVGSTIYPYQNLGIFVFIVGIVVTISSVASEGQKKTEEFLIRCPHCYRSTSSVNHYCPYCGQALSQPEIKGGD